LSDRSGRTLLVKHIAPRGEDIEQTAGQRAGARPVRLRGGWLKGQVPWQYWPKLNCSSGISIWPRSENSAGMSSDLLGMAPLSLHPEVVGNGARRLGAFTPLQLKHANAVTEFQRFSHPGADARGEFMCDWTAPPHNSHAPTVDAVWLKPPRQHHEPVGWKKHTVTQRLDQRLENWSSSYSSPPKCWSPQDLLLDVWAVMSPCDAHSSAPANRGAPKAPIIPAQPSGLGIGRAKPKRWKRVPFQSRA